MLVLEIVRPRGLRNGFNPEMLQIAMDLRGIEIPQLCRSVAITQQQIKDYLDYRSTPDNRKLERIASLLQFPTAFFRREGQYIIEGIHIKLNTDYDDEVQP